MESTSHFRVLIHDLPAQGSRFRLGVRKISIDGAMISQEHYAAFASLLLAAEPGDVMLARSWCVTVVDASAARIDRSVRIRLAALLARAIDCGEARFILCGFDDGASHWIDRLLRRRQTSPQFLPIYL